MEKYNVIREHIIDGRVISYSNETEFLVQVGRGIKGGYKTRYRFKGNLKLAFMYYSCINIGNRYKKRLIMPSVYSTDNTQRKQISFGFMGKCVRQTKSNILAQYSSGT